MNKIINKINKELEISRSKFEKNCIEIKKLCAGIANEENENVTYTCSFNMPTIIKLTNENEKISERINALEDSLSIIDSEV